MEPNVLAYVILFSWPLLALSLYRIWPATQATIGAILGAELILPVGAAVKIPMIPAIDRVSVATVPAVIGCALWAARSGGRIRFGMIEMLIGLFFVSPLITSVLNGDDIAVGGTVLPGVGLYDGLSAVLSQMIFFAPFLIARRFMLNKSDLEVLLRALVVCGLLYSILILLEIRLSPQLHRWVYGYHPHQF